MSDSDLRVAIIGGGIGGLSLGLALRERGLRADVFEQAPELAEIGAAIALSANACASTHGWAWSTSWRRPPPSPPS
jgi:salicylate hydroxylase